MTIRGAATKYKCKDQHDCPSDLPVIMLKTTDSSPGIRWDKVAGNIS